MRIVISGGGVGGLAAAHGLTAAGHDVVVLERGGLPRPGPSGYRLRLDSRAVRVLEGMVPAALWDALLASGTGWSVNQRLTYVDQGLRPLGSTRAGDRDTLMIGRGPLLRLLSHGIADRVRERTAARSFAVTPDSVSVTTADGQVVTGDLVVIAEGVHSAMVGQLVGDPDYRPLGVGGMISGRVPGRAAEHGLDGIAGALADGYVLATGRGGLGLFLSAHDPVAGADIDPAAVGPISPDPEDPYLVWALLGPDEILPAIGASADALRSAVEGLTGHWHGDIARLPRLSQPGSLQRVPLYAAPAVPTWPTTAVTVLGDAIHAVPPTGGIGASTAIRDAGNLVEALSGVTDRAGLLRGLHRYEQTMRTYADDIVVGSVAPLRWQHRLRNPALYTAVTGVRAGLYALTGRSLSLPSRN